MPNVTSESTSEHCPFCTVGPERVIFTNDLVLALWDRFPLSPGHALIVPRRHVAGWTEATEQEREALTRCIALARQQIEQDHAPNGYNIGINDGVAAGQTVLHLHLHVIPRYVGDVPDPRGGVRSVIPERARYWEDA